MYSGKISRKWFVILLALILLVTVLAFSPTLKNSFTNWDDGGYVTQNSLIKSLTWRGVKKIFTTFRMDAYQPFALLSYAIEYRFFGLNPFIYHLTNLIIHALNCILVFWLIFLISRNSSVAFIATFLFSIHPLHVESVAWVSERKGLLCAFFSLWTLICYAYYLLRARKITFYCCSLFFFLCALFSKAAAVMLVLVLFLEDYILLRSRKKALVLKKLPFFVLSSIFGIITIVAHYSGTRTRTAEFTGLFNKILLANYSVVFYLKKIFLPFQLSCLYPPVLKSQLVLAGYLAVSFIVCTLVIYSKRYTKKILFSSLFFLIFLLPTLQFVEIGKSIVADRYVYVASLGIFYIVGEASVWLYHKINPEKTALRLISVVIFVLGMGFLAFLTHQRTMVWKDAFTLWGDVLQKYPDPIVYTNRGIAYAQKGDYEKAFSDYNKAITLDPDFFEAYLNRGIAYYAAGQLHKAKLDYQRAIQINPKVANVYYDLGLAYIKEGNPGQAIFCFTKAVEIHPDYSEAYYYRGFAYASQKKNNQAIMDYSRAIQLEPEYIEPYLGRMALYYSMGDFAMVEKDVRTLQRFGIRIDPRIIETLQGVPRMEKGKTGFAIDTTSRK